MTAWSLQRACIILPYSVSKSPFVRRFVLLPNATRLFQARLFAFLNTLEIQAPFCFRLFIHSIQNIPQESEEGKRDLTCTVATNSFANKEFAFFIADES
jgi:hypothetical protein